MKKIILLILLVLMLGAVLLFFLNGKRFYSEKQVISEYNKNLPEITVLKEFVLNKLANDENFKITLQKELDVEMDSYALFVPGSFATNDKWITVGDKPVDEAIKKLLLTDSIFIQLIISNGKITLQTDKGSLDFANGMICYCGEEESEYEDTYVTVHKKVSDKVYYFESAVNKTSNGQRSVANCLENLIGTH